MSRASPACGRAGATDDSSPPEPRTGRLGEEEKATDEHADAVHGRDLDLTPDDGQRYEIIDGELHVGTQLDWRHQRARALITIRLGIWDPELERGEPMPAPGLIFALDQAVHDAPAQLAGLLRSRRSLPR